MKLYEDRVVNSDLRLRIGTGSPLSYEELKRLKDDDRLEDYDLFTVSSDHFDSLYMFYKGGKYYLVNRAHRAVKEVPEDLLLGRSFVVTTRSITNNVQGFLQRKGTEALAKVKGEQFLGVILGSKYKPQSEIDIDDLLDH